MKTRKHIVRLDQQATAWELIAETIKKLHYCDTREVRDAFHQESLGLEDNFTEAKKLAEKYGLVFIPS